MATFVELETACGPVTVNADLVSIVRKCNESKCYVWFGEDDPMIICEPYEAVKGKIHAACEARNGKHLCASASRRETDAGSAGPVKEEKEETSPHTPLKEKTEEKLSLTQARACTREKSAPFVKPTLDEVSAYIRERGYTFDAEEFVAFYESNGWYVGRRKMKDWKMACVTWQKRERQFRGGYGGMRSARQRPSNWASSTPEQVREFTKGIEGEGGAE